MGGCKAYKRDWILLCKDANVYGVLSSPDDRRTEKDDTIMAFIRRWRPGTMDQGFYNLIVGFYHVQPVARVGKHAMPGEILHQIGRMNVYVQIHANQIKKGS